MECSSFDVFLDRYSLVPVSFANLHRVLSDHFDQWLSAKIAGANVNNRTVKNIRNIESPLVNISCLLTHFLNTSYLYCVNSAQFI